MKTMVLSQTTLEKFKTHLIQNEKSRATIEKYIRDVSAFMSFVGKRVLDKSLVLEFKGSLKDNYAVRSANSKIAALNSFLCFLKRKELCVKQFRLQKEVFCPESRELTKSEYASLINAAKRKNNERLSLVIQTICSTGIRVSELSFITVEAAKKGEAIVSLKGKTRKVFLPEALKKLLLAFAEKHGITSGIIFKTKKGKALDRSNIWREMKALCAFAGVSPQKVFPHNLRHLFARTFYGIEKDIAKLADILGHSNINTTRIYIMSTGAEHRRKLENMHLII